MVSTNNSSLATGMVIRKNRGHYLVQAGERQVPCVLSNRLHKKLIYPLAAPTSLSPRVQEVRDIDAVDPVAIGDRVEWLDPGDGSGMIVNILPRKNNLSRQSINQVRRAGDKEQVIVANLDQVVVVFAAARPNPVWTLLDRYLLSAEIHLLPTLICITKMDLVDPQSLSQPIELYSRLGYQFCLTSTISGWGLEDLRSKLQNKVSLLMGKSGVGKTSLLNALQPGLGLKVGAVGNGDVGKGKHTTSHLELFPLLGGGIIDSPGMRIFSIWDDNDHEIAWYFREMRPLVGKCRFGTSCSHRDEPGCAIRKAVSQGDIHPDRYRSYLALAAELE